MEAAGYTEPSQDHEHQQHEQYYPTHEYEHYHHLQQQQQQQQHAASLAAAADAAGLMAAQHQQPQQHYNQYQQHQQEQQLMTGGSTDHSLQSAEHLAPLLLVTTVDIGDGKADRIEVRQGDVPLEVANAFVAKHNLPTAVVPRLAMHLEENLLKVEAQRHAAGCGSQDGCDDEGLAVFHRLYQQAVALRHKMETRREVIKRSERESIQNNKTTMSWISSEMMRDRSAGPFDNYGEMLYAESLESLARKRDKAQRVKAQRDMEEVQGVTFQPEISRHAQTLWGPHEVGSVPVWQRLSKVKMTKAQERLMMLRREKEEAEVRECTFKPQISGRSEKLMTERSQTLRSLNVSAHQQLYQDAIRRQQKQQDYQHWYPEEVTFQPKLNESAMSREFLRKSLQKEGSSLGPNASGAERHMALVNRLYASYEKLQNKLSEARSTLQNSIDPSTGKRLFHPETGRAPRFSRNTSQQPVSEYLYSLSHQQDEKNKAAAAERERRMRDEATSSKSAQGSKHLIKQLQNKRFKQIFEFLDVDGLGSIDLVAVISSAPEWLDDLDDEVRADLEAAAKLLQKRAAIKHNDSNSSNASGSTIFMPPPPGLDVPAAAASSSSLPPTPTSCAARTVVTFNAFSSLMDEVLATRRGPRAYLAPSPPRKYVPPETYKPQINQRSKQLASRVRPKDTPAFEVLYQENSILNQKLTEKRAAREAETSKQCTFTPHLVSQQLVKEGRVMKAVREGSWWTRAETDSQLCELEGVASLQQLAASVMGEGEPAQDPSCLDESSPESSPAGVAPVGASDADQQPAAAGLVQQLQVSSTAQGPHVAAHHPVDGFASREEQQQYLELEREVAEMQRMLEEATAAAERGQQSHSDQQYLSEILGLAQEQVDAMAPAISQLQGLEITTHRHSHSPSASGAASPTAAPCSTLDGAQPSSTGAAAAGIPAAVAAGVSTAASSRALSSFDNTPKSSFRVKEEPADGSSGSSATAAAAAAAVAAAAAEAEADSLSGASAGQLQCAVTAALQELNASSNSDDLVNKALALSKAVTAAGGEISANSGGSDGDISIAAVKAAGSRSKLQSLNLEGADLFELAAAATSSPGPSSPDGNKQQQQQRQPGSQQAIGGVGVGVGAHSGGTSALESLEELAAGMNLA